MCLEWVETHRDELSSIEVAFLAASKEAEQDELENERRRSRHLRQFAAGLAFAGVLALALATLAYLQGHKAERQSRIALSRQTVRRPSWNFRAIRNAAYYWPYSPLT